MTENQAQFMFAMTPEVEAGVYADFANLWMTDDVFVLDFSSLTQPPQMSVSEVGERVFEMRARVVARVRIPPGQVFEVMKALERQLTAYEQMQAAKRASPSEPLYPPTVVGDNDEGDDADQGGDDVTDDQH